MKPTITSSQRKPLKALLLALFIFVHPETSSAADHKSCERLLANLKTSRNLDLMWSCQEFYWHNGHLENPPSSYNNFIRIGYRYIEISPHESDQYANMAWLLWSKWVTWKKTPEKMPDGEHKLTEAYALALRGRASNPQDSEYHRKIGEVMWFAAKSYSPEYYPFVIESLELADFYSPPSKTQIRIRLTLGHIHRNLQNTERALHWYHKVLELDPNNEVALRLIKELNENHLSMNNK